MKNSPPKKPESETPEKKAIISFHSERERPIFRVNLKSELK